MSQKYYICEKCGNMIELIKESGMSIICCGQDMKELIPCSSDGMIEKHVPEVKVEGNVVTVTIGEKEHPMLDDHYIQWISIETKLGSQKRCLKPGDEPKAEFILTEGDKLIATYAYCNIHRLWKR